MKIISLAIVLNISILCSQQLPVWEHTFGGKYLLPHIDVDNDGVNELINMVYPAADSIEIYHGASPYQRKYKVDIPMDELLWSGIIRYNPFFHLDTDNQIDLLGILTDINGKDVGFQIRTVSTNTALFTYIDPDADNAAQSWIKVYRAPLDGVNSVFIVAIKMFDANGQNETNKTLIFSDPSVSVATSELNFPSKFKLNQNYPNPFNPVTNIPYQINKSSHILLNIYDIKGRLVETLVNKYHEVGSYSAVWNPKELSSGQYFYQMEIDGHPTTARKAIFLK